MATKLSPQYVKDVAALARRHGSFASVKDVGAWLAKVPARGRSMSDLAVAYAKAHPVRGPVRRAKRAAAPQKSGRRAKR